MEKRLFQCLESYDQTVREGAIITPFVPKVGDICTLAGIGSTGGYFFEEVRAFFMGEEYTFDNDVWKEVVDLPSIEELMEQIESDVLTY